ncbi:breast cancer metastasis-suppressor 1 [Dermochelys coriacea]|uniref:breast cancer metastasis-suppressor 1 n=1 Tax=Dermochelys coriacea TaxID=27794 RepID=UPI001CA7E71E|nr:breast cancer metastasis-suppressor 1 [Dermochelys coriacea]
MPVHPVPKEVEEMEGDGDSAPELNGEEEESEEEHSASPSESEEESSEMDEEDCERRRSECLDEMCDLEKQFSELKEKLFKERLNQVKAKLEDVASGRAAEYLDPLGVLQNNMKIRIEVAGIYKGLCLEVVRNKHECELQGAHQHLESEKLLLYDNMQSELLERIQRLEDDRQSIDITSEWWDDKLRPKNSLKKWDPFRPAKRKKAPLVSGPYIVYMLRDIDILEDWTAIKKAKAAVSPQKRKSDVLVKVEKPGAQFSARCEEGRLHYEGEIYSKGQSVILEVGDEAPAHCRRASTRCARLERALSWLSPVARHRPPPGNQWPTDPPRRSEWLGLLSPCTRTPMERTLGPCPAGCSHGQHSRLRSLQTGQHEASLLASLTRTLMFVAILGGCT